MITQAVNLIMAFKLWIRIQVPKIEDGNNFGVSVQLDTIKTLDELLVPVAKAMDDMPSYFEKRAAAWEKLAVKVSKETKKTASDSKEVGGKVREVQDLSVLRKWPGNTEVVRGKHTSVHELCVLVL